MKKLICLLLLFPGLASAASLTIGWTLPTVAVDGTTPLTGANVLTSIQLFLSTSQISDTSTMTPTFTITPPLGTSSTREFTANAGQTVYVRVKACNQWGCSPFTDQVSRLITGPVPGLPTSVTITLNP